MPMASVRMMQPKGRKGLADRAVGALALDATGRTLYAGTASGGVVSLRRSP